MKLWPIAIGAALAALPAIAQEAAFVYTPLGYQQIVTPTIATNLTVPQATRIAEICVNGTVSTISGNVVRYRDDGTAPTSSNGMPVPSGTCFPYSGSLTAIQFIQILSANIDVSYYR